MAEEQKTIFGQTYEEHLSAASLWLRTNTFRLHAQNCTARKPSAQCSCGLHKTLTDVNAVLDDIKRKKKQ